MSSLKTPMKMNKAFLYLLLAVSPLMGGEDISENKRLNLSGFSVEFGYSSRSFDGLKLSVDSFSRNYNSTKLIGEIFSVDPGAGSFEGLLDRSYDNGFVRKDDTGSIGGVTWFWGYDDIFQVDQDVITFTDTSGKDVDHKYSQITDHYSKEGSERGNGPMFSLSYQFKGSKSLSYSAGLNISNIRFDNSWGLSNFSAVRNTDVTQYIIEDSYNLLGSVPPEPPYTGKFSEPGVLIEAVPSERNISLQDYPTEKVQFNNQIDKDFEFSMTSFSPALTLSYGLKNFFLDFGFGPTVNVIDWKSNYSESLKSSNENGESNILENWSDQSSGEDVVLGAFLQVSAGLNINNNWSLKAFTRKDWAKDFENEVGASRINFDLGGMSAGMSATFSF